MDRQAGYPNVMANTTTASEERELRLTLEALQRGGAGPNLGRDTIRRALQYARQRHPVDRGGRTLPVRR